jgi:hypothetical protein
MLIFIDAKYIASIEMAERVAGDGGWPGGSPGGVLGRKERSNSPKLSASGIQYYKILYNIFIAKF